VPDVSFTELPGRRVVLRRFRPQDVAEFVAYRSRAEVARYQSWDVPYPQEEGERFVGQMTRQHPDTPGEWFQFAVGLRATGQLIGDCAAMTRADDPGQCEIGFTIAPQYQGRGYAAEAARLLVGYLFARGKHRITACCDARNAASVAVLERLGMRREGHLRQSTWAKGEWTDDLLYALLQDEWQTSRGSKEPDL
jgi:RimJ/RimL family protein N-acetyltransferase